VNWPDDSSGLHAVLRGGSGTDRVSFGLVPRRIHVDLGAGGATFGKSILRLRTIDEVLGSTLTDTLLGGPGDDVLRGFGGDDVLRGRSGADVLVGDDGHDVAFGGPGHDTCDAEVRRFC
jgi:Ca2+-binding RTX toxin-like protein